MKKIGLISDTHGYINNELFDFFKECDEIWHAGDIGNIQTADKLAEFKELKAVFGNMDGQDIRIVHPKNNRFICEGVDVWITHIGGYPGHYENAVKPEIFNNPPKLFICGHSHILKIINDKKLNLLHINPGAAGKTGPQKVSTAIRFTIENGNIKDLEILELKKNA